VQTLELFIDGTQAEMFKDESVQLTQTIQNVKDIGSIFTDFSRSFNLPASKHNNKLFKHYYDINLTNTVNTPTFLANDTLPAEIKLNNRLFKKGFIALDGVSMKENKPYAYKVTFFGETIKIKNALKAKTLQDIFQSITTYDHEYSVSNVVQGLETSLFSGAVRYPLIVNGADAETFGTNRLFYNGNSHSSGDNNLHYDTSGGGSGSHNHGVKKTMLKPALKVSKIIEAIESQVDLEFTKTASDDFFNTSVNDIYDDLYLWLSRTKGNIGLNVTGTAEVNMPITDVDFTNANPNQWNPESTGSTPAYLPYSRVQNGIWTFRSTKIDFNNNTGLTYALTFNITSSSTYSIFIEEVSSTPVVVQSKTNVTGTNGISTGWFSSTTSLGQLVRLRCRVTSEDPAITFIPTITYGQRDYSQSPYPLEQITTVTGTDIEPNGAVSNIVVSDQIPDLKVVDFLTGLFKMFNLTAYVQDDGKIKVQTLDEFYDTSTDYDVTEFVDSKESSVDFAIPYQEIAYRFPEPKTFLAINHKELFNYQFGNQENTTTVSQDVQTTNRGNKYVVDVPFGKMLYERLNDINGGSQTPFQYGYCTDKEQNPTNIEPLIFINENVNVSTDKLSFQDGVSNGTADGLTSYNRPCNVLSGTTKYSINFGEEIDEFSGEAVENSLFYTYYRNYIIDVFNERRRLTKLTAYLPLRVLLNYTLADTFIVNGKRYKINSITTDFMTGKSELELLNEV
jgi:hypothetical protein